MAKGSFDGLAAKGCGYAFPLAVAVQRGRMHCARCGLRLAGSPFRCASGVCGAARADGHKRRHHRPGTARHRESDLDEHPPIDNRAEHLEAQALGAVEMRQAVPQVGAAVPVVLVAEEADRVELIQQVVTR